MILGIWPRLVQNRYPWTVFHCLNIVFHSVICSFKIKTFHLKITVKSCKNYWSQILKQVPADRLLVMLELSYGFKFYFLFWLAGCGSHELSGYFREGIFLAEAEKIDMDYFACSHFI